MSRLIDADELSKWISGQSKSPSCPKNESAFGLRIIKHIDRMPSVQPEVLACGSGELNVQPEPQWIPVSEGLPETEEFVLASLTGKYRNTTFEHACEIADYADGEWCVYAYPHMSAEKCEELIEAWMPLPKPFEGGTE